MSFRIITIPFNQEQGMFHEEELNKFLLNKTLKQYRTEFFKSNEQAYWTVFIEYETILNDHVKINNSFNETEKTLQQKLREWRRQKAENMGLPVYIIFANQQLDEMVRLKPGTLEALKRVRGFGEKKMASYGHDIIEIVKGFYSDKHE